MCLKKYFASTIIINTNIYIFERIKTINKGNTKRKLKTFETNSNNITKLILTYTKLLLLYEILFNN